MELPQMSRADFIVFLILKFLLLWRPDGTKHIAANGAKKMIFSAQFIHRSHGGGAGFATIRAWDSFGSCERIILIYGI